MYISLTQSSINWDIFNINYIPKATRYDYHLQYTGECVHVRCRDLLIAVYSGLFKWVATFMDVFNVPWVGYFHCCILFTTLNLINDIKLYLQCLRGGV